MPELFQRYRVIILTLLIVLGLFVSMWLAGRYAEQRAWQERSEEAQGQLQLYAQSIHTVLERFRALPKVLALDSDIRTLLQAQDDPLLRDTLNRRLERLNSVAGSSVLYLLDLQGKALVASNWRDWSSFVGNSYAFRPYFQNALRDGHGQYFAVGVTTGIPGYFLAHAVNDLDGNVLGVLVVKLELEELQREWVSQPGVFMVSDSYGVAILSNRPGWRFRMLKPLSEQDREELVGVRKYAEQALQPLSSRLLRTIAPTSQWRRVMGPDGVQDYLWQQQDLGDEGWTLHLLSEPGNLLDTVRSYRLAAGGLWMTLAFLLLYLAQRRKNQRLQAGIRERLEHEVALRTQELREAQDGLVHAAKLAALGQMSAAMAHEINQPLTAMRMQLGSLHLLLASGRQDEVEKGLQRIDELLQRIAGLTGHLKTFARKTPAGQTEPLLLADVLEQALQLLAPRLRSERIQLHREIDNSVRVEGDAIRLEHVLVNLLNNAVDAMAAVDNPQLWITLRAVDGCCRLSIADNGGGLDAQALAHVFEPFFTTKPVGAGLGLGLAVSYGIMRELGGSLSAANGEQGAVFTLSLALAE
ncbi:sensor histidine kinase [Pseudomonas sp. TTU2014-080ASC]|uniref:sensor histidine kinase n=1 Tax=Pseudomonas sp. TTU2014-080ASC TaxID=1729724 RepID=UPI000718A538|nr:ATP-binding protein [Pseudomonas sp. TTU2014-080ASC]KRW61691.1 cytochrome C biogenesis protein CcmE [Pseudomonas sp. TTU2014-080ASC]